MCPFVEFVGTPLGERLPHPTSSLLTLSADGMCPLFPALVCTLASRCRSGALALWRCGGGRGPPPRPQEGSYWSLQHASGAARRPAHPSVRPLLCLEGACNLPCEHVWSAAQPTRRSPMLRVRLETQDPGPVPVVGCCQRPLEAPAACSGREHPVASIHLVTGIQEWTVEPIK